jgi:hypothetical protein
MDDLNEILDARANASGTKEIGNQVSDRTLSSSTALAMPDDDGFAIAGEFADRNMLRGQLPKFIDGIWSLGGQQLPREVRYAVVGVKACMVRWEDQRWPAGPDGQRVSFLSCAGLRSTASAFHFPCRETSVSSTSTVSSPST